MMAITIISSIRVKPLAWERRMETSWMLVYGEWSNGVPKVRRVSVNIL